MSVARPFRRTCRQFIDGKYDDRNNWQINYVKHLQYAKSPQQYIRAFLLLQKDLHELFDYAEPSDRNLQCYSYRIHELLNRTCMEIEANCKAILTENSYTKTSDLTMSDYRKLNATHRLSSYKVKLPLWDGTQDIRLPFSSWSGSGQLLWYKAYNEVKHDRHGNFGQASFDNLLNAICGLVVMLASQFHTHDFSALSYLTRQDHRMDWKSAIGGYFLVKFPDDWPNADRYEFEWNGMEMDADPFQNLVF